MLLTPKPASVLTHEQNILWSVSELRKTLVSQPLNDAAPRKIIEAEGYYASDVISIQEITPPASTPRHVVRMLVPISPGYYGASQPVWNFAGVLALGLDTPIGLAGIGIPERTEKIRFNPGVAAGTIERMQASETVWNNSWGGSAGIEEAYLVSRGPQPGIWMRQSSSYPNPYHRNVPGVWTWETNTLEEFTAAIAQPGTVRL